jgi:hypothetical protein
LLGNPSAVQLLPTKARAILALELRGLPKTQIAVRLHMKEDAVRRITRTDRYIAGRDAALDRMDAEFHAMKPAAFEAVWNGLKSRDENTGLRAAELWMKATGFMQHGKGEATQGVTAEDVAKQMLQLNVTVNVEPGQHGRGG